MISKRAVFTISGNPTKADSKVYFEITFDRVPQYSGHGTLRANPELHAQLVEHWDNYRQLVRQNRRSLTYLDEEYAEDAETPEPEQPYRIQSSEVERVRRVRKDDCDRTQEQLRTTFLQWLDESVDCRQFNRQARDLLQRDDDFQFVIRYSDAEIERLPWHEWDLFCDRKATEPSFSPLSSLYNEPIEYRARDRVKVLVILGNSAGIDIQKDRQFFNRLSLESNADITFLDEPKPEEIDDSLWKQGWDVICFSGHSSSEEGRGKIYINSQGDYLLVEDLRHGLKKALSNGLRLTVFNSCDGLKIAKSINDLSIPYAIVMREAITDTVAHTFLKYFLENFAAGRSLQASVREARERLDFLGRKVPCPSWLPIVIQTPFAETLYWSDLYCNDGSEENDAEPATEEIAELQPEPISIGNLVRDNLKGKLSYLKFILPTLVLLALAAVPISSFLTLLGESIAFGFYETDMRRQAQVLSRNLFRVAVVLNRFNPDAHMQLGNSYDDMGDFEEARRHLRRAYDLGSGLACSNLGRMHIRSGELDMAQTKLDSCLLRITESDDHAMSRYYKNLGWLMYEFDRFDMAESYLKTALQNDSDYGDAGCLMAKTLEAKEQTTQARRHWVSCLANTKGYLPEVRLWRGQAKQALSQGGEGN